MINAETTRTPEQIQREAAIKERFLKSRSMDYLFKVLRQKFSYDSERRIEQTLNYHGKNNGVLPMALAAVFPTLAIFDLEAETGTTLLDPNGSHKLFSPYSNESAPVMPSGIATAGEGKDQRIVSFILCGFRPDNDRVAKNLNDTVEFLFHMGNKTISVPQTEFPNFPAVLPVDDLVDVMVLIPKDRSEHLLYTQPMLTSFTSNFVGEVVFSAFRMRYKYLEQTYPSPPSHT